MDKRTLISGKRTNLVDIIPLEVPLAIELEITNACNLKCEFCGHSSEKFKQAKIKNIGIEIIKKMVRDVSVEGV